MPRKTAVSLISVFSLVILLALFFLREDNWQDPLHLDKDMSLAHRWYNAVLNGKFKVSIELAEKLVPKDKIQLDIDPEYIELCASNGLSPQFLTKPFNPLDFQYWHHAVFFKQLAEEIVEGEGEVIPALFAAVTNKLEPVDPPVENILWPYRIWQLCKGACDRQAWVLCELSYQCGYDTQIVYLRNPKTLRSPHTICELRKNNEVWLADPFSRILLSDTSIEDIMKDPKLRQATWPDRPDWQLAITAPHFFTPSYPQDYCNRNQLLFRTLQARLSNGCPRFGEIPNQRLYSYKKYLDTPQNSKIEIGLWHYPFRLLAFQAATIDRAVRKPRISPQQ